MKEILYVVVPCYNEEEVLLETTKHLTKKLQDCIDDERISELSRIIYVNDGSKDSTWQIISDLHKTNNLVNGISLSRNRGHQNALIAGLEYAKEHADMVISMDADLQDDINTIDGFIKAYYDGNDVVYGVRSQRKTDTFFKKTTAEMFYRLMNFLGVDIVFNHADYRLMSKRALYGLSEYKEVNLFLRGIVPLIGYNSSVVYYERSERFAGESKYPLKKMLAFAIEGITSFSIKPIRLITFTGISIFVISLCMLVYFLFLHFTGHTIQGWTTLVISIWALGGIQLLAIGIIGEYIGKVYLETKSRPKYFVKDYLTDQDKR